MQLLLSGASNGGQIVRAIWGYMAAPAGRRREQFIRGLKAVATCGWAELILLC